MIEQHYHSADLFRRHLNVFIKAIKEVPKLIKMKMQNENGFKAWYAPHHTRLAADPLLCVLSKRRDFIVYQGTLKLDSHGTIVCVR